MTLKYNFTTSEIPVYRNDWDVDYETEGAEFEYDPSFEDMKAFYHQLDKISFIDACKHAFDNLSEENKAFFLDPDNGYALPEYMNDNEFNWSAVYDDIDGIKDDVISELLFDDAEYLEDDMKDYFKDAAEEAFEDLDY